MAEITRITRHDLPVRTSGTVLSEVRRPQGEVAKKAAVTPKKTPKAKSDG